MKRLNTRVTRSGFAAQEVVIAMVLLLTFTVGMYFIAQDCFARLYHFMSTNVGGPYS